MQRLKKEYIEKIQNELFCNNDAPEIKNNWEKEWFDMPEFVQEKKEPYAKIIVRFETEEDLMDFAKLIGQKLTCKTKSIWHPYKSHFGHNKKKEWVDES